MPKEHHLTGRKAFDRIIRRTDVGILFGYWGVRFFLPTDMLLIDRMPDAVRAGVVRHVGSFEPNIEYDEVAA